MITNNCYNDRKNTQNNNNDRDDNNHQFHVNSWPRQFTASRHRHNQRKGLHSGEWVDRPSKASYCIQVLQLKSLECRYIWLEIFPFKDIIRWTIFFIHLNNFIYINSQFLDILNHITSYLQMFLRSYLNLSRKMFFRFSNIIYRQKFKRKYN